LLQNALNSIKRLNLHTSAGSSHAGYGYCKIRSVFDCVSAYLFIRIWSLMVSIWFESVLSGLQAGDFGRGGALRQSDAKGCSKVKFPQHVKRRHPPKIFYLFFGFIICPSPLRASIRVLFAQSVSFYSLFEDFTSSCPPLCPLVFYGSSANHSLNPVLTHG